ncbi:hypothetical protein FITA111629_07210 [Filibacter tadaridae]
MLLVVIHHSKRKMVTFMNNDVAVSYLYAILLFVGTTLLVGTLLYNVYGTFKISFLFVSLSGGGIPGFIVGAALDCRIAEKRKTTIK